MAEPSTGGGDESKSGGGGGGGGGPHTKKRTHSRPPSTFGSLRPEPRKIMHEGVLHPRHDALVFDRLYNYRLHATSRTRISTYGLDTKGARVMVDAIDMSLSRPSVPQMHGPPPNQLHYSLQLQQNAAASRPSSPSASFRSIPVAAASNSSQFSSTSNSFNASFSASAAAPPQRSTTPKLCRTPNLTAGKFQDMTTPRRSGTPTLNRSGLPSGMGINESRVSHNCEVLGGVTHGSWRETEKWVRALRNDDIQFKKRPLPKQANKPAAEDDG